MSRREREERIHELLKHVQQQRLDLALRGVTGWKAPPITIAAGSPSSAYAAIWPLAAARWPSTPFAVPTCCYAG